MTWPSSGQKKIQTRVANIDSTMAKIIAGQFLYAEGEATAIMKEGAPWTDRSGNARAGLFAKASFYDNAFELLLAHSVYYGIFLEVANSGKYAIILPTVQHMGDLLIARMERAMSRLEGLL